MGSIMLPPRPTWSSLGPPWRPSSATASCTGASAPQAAPTCSACSCSCPSSPERFTYWQPLDIRVHTEGPVQFGNRCRPANKVQPLTYSLQPSTVSAVNPSHWSPAGPDDQAFRQLQGGNAPTCSACSCSCSPSPDRFTYWQAHLTRTHTMSLFNLGTGAIRQTKCTSWPKA
jgi:hypothetical protein